jgi:predicted RNase H-like nuclease
MNIYKLKYTTKAAAEKDLKKKGLLEYLEGVHAVVELGKIITTDATYDEEGNELTAPIYASGYHYDVMCEQDIDFGSNSIEVNNPKHVFLGHNN